jgi:hypothetical protein
MIEKHVFGRIALDLPESLQRADLEFYGINHFRPSFTALIFFNDAEVDENSASADRESFAGSFSIFGHQRCSGSEGHCEVHPYARRFDDRPSHPLTRAFKRVVVTPAVQRVGRKRLTITVIAASDPGEEADFDGPLLDSQGMQLTTFA